MANQQEWPHVVDAPQETGPDYVALVIEWDDADNDVTQVIERHPAASPELKKVMMGAGALAALLLARWGVHRLRHA